MEQITKGTLIKMPDGELISPTEYVARKWERKIANSLSDETLRNIRFGVERGATYEDLEPFYFLSFSDEKRKALESLGVDVSALFRRIHGACVEKVVN